MSNRGVIAGYVRKQLGETSPSTQPPWDAYVWAKQEEPAADSLIDGALVTDLTDKVDADGRLVWDVPEGMWVVLRMGMVPIGTPFKTISAAADMAQPGDTITVHEGVYRERINPPHGGTSDKKRIVYQAAKGEKVVIKGSEVVTGWKKLNNDTWQVTIPNSFFGEFNPYSDLISGDWFYPKGRKHHTGAVYLKGHRHSQANTTKNQGQQSAAMVIRRNNPPIS